MNDKLTINPQKPPIGGFRKGIAANRDNFERTLKSIDPNTVPNRLGLIIDDSGSMGQDGMENAHTAIKSFTQSCNHTDTSIAVYPINAANKPLTCDYDLVNLYVNGIWATGGTELYSKLKELIEKENITRAIAFSDGSPTDSHISPNAEGMSNSWNWGDDGTIARKTVAMYVEKKVPVDTIYIGYDTDKPYKEMAELARVTGGVFVHFKDTASLSSSLKYLSPGFRGLLANPEIKARIERGEKV